MAKAHALELHHPVNRPTTDLATKAVPQVLGRGHDQAGGIVGMKRATPGQVFAQLLQVNTSRLDQALRADLFF
jgi:hypothetical protein